MEGDWRCKKEGRAEWNSRGRYAVEQPREIFVEEQSMENSVLEGRGDEEFSVNCPNQKPMGDRICFGVTQRFPPPPVEFVRVVRVKRSFFSKFAFIEFYP